MTPICDIFIFLHITICCTGVSNWQRNERASERAARPACVCSLASSGWQDIIALLSRPIARSASADWPPSLVPGRAGDLILASFTGWPESIILFSASLSRYHAGSRTARPSGSQAGARLAELCGLLLPAELFSTWDGSLIRVVAGSSSAIVICALERGAKFVYRAQSADLAIK